MSHASEQKEELEALEAIYGSEFSIISDEYPNISFAITISPAETSGYQDENEEVLEAVLSLSLPESYPACAPVIEIEGLEDSFSEERIEQVKQLLEKTAEENLEMPMAFTIVSALQEELGNLVNELKTAKELEDDKKRQALDEIVRRKIEGTPVTVENFIKWKTRFDDERAAAREKQLAAERAALAGKLTGRQQFLRDATLILSDLALIQEVEGGAVQIDESLFDDIDDLDIDDDDDDDDEDEEK